MKTSRMILAAMVVSMILAAIIVMAGMVAQAEAKWEAAKAEEDHAGLVEYRVISSEPVVLDEVMGLFISGLGQGGKVETLVPKTTGVGLIQRWNTHLPGLTWKTPLIPGTTIWLPAKWRMWGVQGILEPAKAPLLTDSRLDTGDIGKQFWPFLLALIFMTGLSLVALDTFWWLRQPKESRLPYGQELQRFFGLRRPCR